MTIKDSNLQRYEFNRKKQNSNVKNNKKDDSSNDNNNNDNNDKTKVLLNGNRISSESMALIQDQYIKSMESFVEFGSFSDNDSEASDDEEFK